MPYTIKLDWTYNRAETVARYLSVHRSTVGASKDLSAHIANGGPGDGWTMKFDWPSELLTEIQDRLSQALGLIARMIERTRQGEQFESSYEDLCADQAQVYAAIGDIADYRAAHDAAMAEIRKGEQ